MQEKYIQQSLFRWFEVRLRNNSVKIMVFTLLSA